MPSAAKRGPAKIPGPGSISAARSVSGGDEHYTECRFCHIRADVDGSDFTFTVKYTSGSMAGETETFRLIPVSADSFTVQAPSGISEYRSGTYRKYPQYQYPDPEEDFFS